MPDRKTRDAFTPHNNIIIIRGGADYFKSLEKIIDDAQYTLHFQTYIYDEDETGKQIANALIRAAARNVNVYLLLDGYASQNLSKTFVSQLINGGVNFRFFNPFFKSEYFYLARRLHHKVIVADSSVGMVAGINVSNRYNDIGETKAWLDWAAYVEGNICKELHNTCERIWKRQFLFKAPSKLKNKITSPEFEPGCEVRIRRNDWVMKKIEITRTYKQIFKLAQKEVLVMTSYFWPPKRLLKAMASASKRGVVIKLVLSGNADVPFNRYAETFLYEYLFRNNIEVYEYQPNILHGKVTVCDGEWYTLGSYNLNNISALASVEMNLDVKDKISAGVLRNHINRIIEKDCIRITRDTYTANTNPLKQFAYFISYNFIHFMFFLFTFYFEQKIKHRVKHP